MWPFPTTINDHRGQPLPLYSPRKSERNRDDFPEAEFRVLAARVREGSIFELLTTPIMVWGIVLLAGVGLTYRVARTGGFAWPLTIFLGVVLIASLFRGRLAPASARHITGAMLELHRCPSCAFTLKGRAPEDDRCVICPECGGAWVLPLDIFADERQPVERPSPSPANRSPQR